MEVPDRLLQTFRPTGEGVEAVVPQIPGRADVLARLRLLFAATYAPESEVDWYFVVRRPTPASAEELVQLGANFLAALRCLAPPVGSIEFTGYISRSLAVELAAEEQAEPEEDALVQEEIGDWLAGLHRARLPGPELRELFYMATCDYFLAAFLAWPFLCDREGCDPFRPYFELWRRGVRVRFGPESLILELAPNNSFKPTPHRGVGHVPTLRWHASATPLRGGLTQALGR